MIQVPEMINPQSSNAKSDVVILPLSLEDNSTITGTACILEEFGKEFSISCNHDTCFLTFNDNTKTFDLKEARSRFEFLTLLEKHKSEMKELKLQLDKREKKVSKVLLWYRLMMKKTPALLLLLRMEINNVMIMLVMMMMVKVLKVEKLLPSPRKICLRKSMANSTRCMTVWRRKCGRLSMTQTLLHSNDFSMR